MAETNNTVRTVVVTDTTKAQQSVVKYGAVAADSTKTLEERIAAKNKQVGIQNDLSEEAIADYKEKIKLLEKTEGNEKKILQLQTKLNREQVKQTRQNSAATKTLNGLNDKLDDSKNSFKNLDKATGGVISSFKAFIANPIGATLAVIAGLFTVVNEAINSTEDGAASLNAITGAMSQIFTNLVNVLSGALQPILDLIVGLISRDFNPLMEQLGGYIEVAKLGFKALGDAITLILTPIRLIISGLKALGQVAQGNLEGAQATMTDFKDSTVEAATSMKENFVGAVVKAVRTTQGLQKAFDETTASSDSLITRAAQIEVWQNAYNKRLRETNLENAKLRSGAKEELAQTKNLELTYAEREEALGRYATLQREISANQKASLDEEIRLMDARRSLGGNTLEDEEAYNQLLIRRIALDGELADRERDISNRGREFKVARQKDEDEDEKRKADIRQRDFDAQLALDELDLERIRTKGERTTELELAILQKRKDNELANAELTGLERSYIVKRYADEEKRITEETAEAKNEANANYTDDAISLTKQALGAIFGDNKAVAITIASIDMLRGIMKGVAQGFPAGLPAIASASLTGAISIQKISAAQAPAGVTEKKTTATKATAPSIPKLSGLSSSAAVSDIANNNQARLGVSNSALTNSASNAANGSVGAQSSGNVIFSEGSYQDFQNQVQFAEAKSTF